MSAASQPSYSEAVFPGHFKLLAESGITPEVAAARSYRSADTKAQCRALGFKQAQCRPPGLLLPTWSPVTHEIAGWQLRPDEPRVDQQRSRLVKYETAAARPVVVDAHPHTWDRLDDPAIPLFVTEGIRKADSAISIGLCCLALLGVWNWRGANDKGGKTALPEWEAIALNGRKVYVVFDSDVMENPSVHQAMARLKTFLEAKGAEVSVIYLPSGPGGVKVGLDDFLVSGRDRDDLLALASSELRPLPDGEDEDQSEPEDTYEDVAVEAGPELLDGVMKFIARFVAFARPEYLIAAALWVAHTHAVGGFDSTPRLAPLSPEKQSGKTRLLEVADLLVPRPMLASNCTPAALFRSIAARQPTVLFDEVDAIFGPKASGDHEDLRALINAGHRKGATVARCVGDGAQMQVQDFPVFAAMALAGIGDLPDTILDRCIVLRMRRRAPGETVEPFRRRLAQPDAHALRRRLAAWAKRNAEALAQCIPKMPDGITDRPADVWEPLVAVADVAGGHWPQEARSAAQAMVKAQADDTGTGSLGVRLLADTKAVFDATEEDRLPTEDLIRHLIELEESPWGDLRGKPLGARGLARRLRPYEVHSKNVKVAHGAKVVKGYALEDLHDPWARYLPPSIPPGSATTATEAETGGPTCGNAVADAVADGSVVADASATESASATGRNAVTREVAEVAEVADFWEGVPPGARHAPTNSPEPAPEWERLEI